MPAFSLGNSGNPSRTHYSISIRSFCPTFIEKYQYTASFYFVLDYKYLQVQISSKYLLQQDTFLSDEYREEVNIIFQMEYASVPLKLCSLFVSPIYKHI
jgi:hypothetical protein